MKKVRYPLQYSHFGTVSVPVLNRHQEIRYTTTVILRTVDTDNEVHVFYGGKEVDALTLLTAENLKNDSADPYINAGCVFIPKGYNRLRTNGRNRRR